MRLVIPYKLLRVYPTTRTTRSANYHAFLPCSYILPATTINVALVAVLDVVVVDQTQKVTMDDSLSTAVYIRAQGTDGRIHEYRSRE